MNFSWLSMRGGGARDDDPNLFLFTRTNFFEAIGDKGRRFVNSGFLVGKEKNKMLFDMGNKMTIGSFIMP